MELGSPPQSGEDTEVLWRYVAELYKVVRAQGNIRVVFNSTAPTQGSNNVTDTENVIILS
jgi:hypothetical protein